MGGEQGQRRIGGGGEIHSRAAACIDTLHQQRAIAMDEGAFSRDGGKARHLAQGACDGCGAALFEDQHTLAAPGQLARHAGAARTAACHNGVVRGGWQGFHRRTVSTHSRVYVDLTPKLTVHRIFLAASARRRYSFPH